MTEFHQVARTLHSTIAFRSRTSYADMWERLRKRFPSALACVLMPDHLHLILEWVTKPLDPRGSIAWNLSHELSAFARRYFPGQKLWEAVPPPTPIPNLLQLRRQIRYAHLNPCRAQLVNDPLEWEWSTHRDLVGAAFPSWPDHAKAANRWKVPLRDFGRHLHDYTSGDPSVRIEGTSLPQWSGGIWAVSLPTLTRAVHQTLRSHSDQDHRRSSPARRLTVLLADQLGVIRKTALAQWVGTSDRTIRAILAQPTSLAETQALQAAQQILADPKRFGIRG
jgi:REP element-mobilizing transposase RayT